MPGGMYSLGDPHAGDTEIELDDQLPRYREGKRAALDAGRGPYREQTFVAADAVVASWLCSVLRAEHPGHMLETALRSGLDDLMAGIQEDLVVMQREEGAAAAHATAAYTNVCFPSGWCPRCFHGRDFFGLHEKVPAEGNFKAKNRERLAERLFNIGLGPTVRFVWSVASDGQLDRRHCELCGDNASLTPWPQCKTPFLRVERQVIVPLDARFSAFLIRVYMAPVSSLSPEALTDLVESVRRMDEAVARYKGLLRHRDHILALLASAAL